LKAENFSCFSVVHVNYFEGITFLSKKKKSSPRPPEGN